MIPSSPIPVTIDYAPQGTRCPLTTEQAQRGLVPLSCIPAQTWNMLWYETNEAMRCVKYAADTLMCEINTVLSCAGVTACAECNGQFRQAIDNLLKVTGTTEVAGSVKSSATPGMVSIDNNGFMTVNNVGNASQLNTSCHIIVDAINEINTAYGNAFTTLWGNASTTNSAKANNDHRSATADYGVGSASVYGHLKITDDKSGSAQDTAASQAAVYDIYNTLMNTAALNNDIPQGFGNASAGVAFGASRSDHVHARNFWLVNCSWVVYSPTITSYSKVSSGMLVTCDNINSVPSEIAWVLDHGFVCDGSCCTPRSWREIVRGGGGWSGGTPVCIWFQNGVYQADRTLIVPVSNSYCGCYWSTFASSTNYGCYGNDGFIGNRIPQGTWCACPPNSVCGFCLRGCGSVNLCVDRGIAIWS